MAVSRISCSSISVLDFLMIEEIGDLWDYHAKGDWICITTNGMVKNNGRAVMGRGCAREAANAYAKFPMMLGTRLSLKGNKCFVFVHERIITFPVKHKWFETADLELIAKSANELRIIMNNQLISRIYIPRPGCGNGGLDWSVVQPVLAKYLKSDKFIVITK